jgi:acyl dehydratase
MPAKELIGEVLSTGSATASAEHVARFAEALGDANARYRGEAAVAPPTYPIAFMAQAMAGGAETFQKLELNYATLVHGEQEFEYVRPIRVGESLTLTGRIGDISEKRSSSGAILDFVVLETEARDASEQVVFYSRNVLISRRAA